MLCPSLSDTAGHHSLCQGLFLPREESMAQTMRQTTHKEVLGCNPHGVSGITSALLPARYSGSQNPSFNSPVLSRASPSLVVLCEGLSRTQPGKEHLLSSLPSAKPSPPLLPVLRGQGWKGCHGEERIEPSVPGGDGAPHTHAAPIPSPPHAHTLSQAPRVFQRVPPCSSVPEGWVLPCSSQLFLPSPFSSFFSPPPSKYNKSPKSPANEKPLFVRLFPLLSATAEY